MRFLAALVFTGILSAQTFEQHIDPGCYRSVETGSVYCFGAAQALPVVGPTVPAPTVANIVEKPLDLPQHWIGAGAGYNPYGSPKGTGWASVALLLSQGAQIYSYSSYDVVPVKGSVPTISTRTGLATVMRSFGPNLILLGFGTAGLAQGANTLTGSFSGGGILVWRVTKDLTFEIAARYVRNGSNSTPVYEFGFGRTF